MFDIFLELCELKGVKIADVAKATGIAPQTFSDWKRGKYTPKIEKLQQIAIYFDVSLEYLMGNETPEHYTNERTAQMAQRISENRELALLFDAAKDASPEDLETVHAMLLALKRKEQRNG